MNLTGFRDSIVKYISYHIMLRMPTIIDAFLEILTTVLNPIHPIISYIHKAPTPQDPYADYPPLPAVYLTLSQTPYRH